MGFSLDEVVPWGRSFDEYRAMFSLSEADLERRIVDCAAGPSDFTAEATARGTRVTAVDPLYAFARADIERRIEQTFEVVMQQNRQHRDDFVWTRHGSVEELGRARMTTMRRFLDDYDMGHDAGRYVPAELPALPFADATFDLALCSHLLFLYSAQLTRAFHTGAILEMARVATEIRIFPLVELGNAPSRHLGAVIDDVVGHGLAAEVERVDYEFQLGGDEMLSIGRR